MRYILIIACLVSVVSLASCVGEYKEPAEVNKRAMTNQEIIKRSGTKFRTGNAAANKIAMDDAMNRLKSGGGLFGKKGLVLGGDDNDKNKVTGMAMPINPYLWRAGLETISFMPIASADPFGGIVITDWYNDVNNTDERCKINIFIKGVELTTSNLKASIFCQELVSGSWIDKQVDVEKSASLENAILEKAKKIRLAGQ
ncbi:MAG: hypothetical protein CFH21_00138 [Alphaproteobacteria bacterium MarineAlpha5_Bin11]|nr:hypothetical protein [Pelagibacteraceae bacterium]PPR44890.1 MAG: hypothetical protein CFH21_00138 [Alphaproteobacteria bacterium MarineAlpha5_Bin11]PPR51854.1 MAG: hypothetical protein CFH20_00272 [Alphaproteobacteria bacterium MarineAlpha5_Bin10]|tara:strand:- start:34 stop:630 length:597 start_codon:yes stop_codon:yes gene_type:complete